MWFYMCWKVFALLIVIELFRVQNLLFEWSKWCMPLWWLRQSQKIQLSDTWWNHWILKEDFMVTSSPIKQQHYPSRGFVFKYDKGVGFMSKSVKDSLWVRKWWYCCGTLFLDREQFVSQIWRIACKPTHRKLVVAL